MTEWEVVGVIVVLAGLVLTIAKPIVNLNGSIVKLTTLLDSLDKRNQLDHERIDERLRCHGEALDDHESRITKLEVQR